MLLETLDIKENDIIIYSKNVFNPDNNFRIIFKDDPKKTPRKISYGDVCRFVNEFTPKNLIAYKLLTNVNNLEVFSTKYGFFLYINGVTELIYFDPVYAVKDLEEIVKDIDKDDLRFRIQQVGLTVLNRKDNLPNFAEIYSIDLEAREAKFQNDKAFVEAIFSNIKRPSTKPLSAKKPAPPGKIEPAPLPQQKKFDIEEEKIVIQKSKQIRDEKETSETIKFINHTIAEDKEFDYKQIMKINSRKAKNIEEGYAFPKAVVDNKNSGALKDYLNKGKSIKNEKMEVDGSIFKSPDSLKKFAEGKEDKKIVLRMR